MRYARVVRLGLLSLSLIAGPVLADTVFYNNDFPDGKMATASGTIMVGGVAHETESADDFSLAHLSRITGGSFTGLVPLGADTSAISSVGLEIYRVFPADSILPETGSPGIPTRKNSPADVDIGAAARDSSSGNLTFTLNPLNENVSVSNSVVDGIVLNEGGNLAKDGREVRIDFTVDPKAPLELAAGDYFFVPQVTLKDGSSFLWLSADRPIGAFGATQLATDRQTWIRNETIANNWLRVGTDIIGAGNQYNAAFRLVGTVVPEPTGIVMLIAGLIAVGAWSQRKRA